MSIESCPRSRLQPLTCFFHFIFPFLFFSYFFFFEYPSNRPALSLQTFVCLPPPPRHLPSPCAEAFDALPSHIGTSNSCDHARCLVPFRSPTTTGRLLAILYIFPNRPPPSPRHPPAFRRVSFQTSPRSASGDARRGPTDLSPLIGPKKPLCPHEAFSTSLRSIVSSRFRICMYYSPIS